MKRLSFLIILLAAGLAKAQQLDRPIVLTANLGTVTPVVVANVPRSATNGVMALTIQNRGACDCIVWGGVSNTVAGYWLAPTNGYISISFPGVWDNRQWWGVSSNCNTTVTSILEPKK